MTDGPAIDKPKTDIADLARNGLVIILLIAIGVSMLAVLTSVSDAMRIWFRPQWVPFARTIAGILVGAAALYALKLLLQRR